MIPMRDNCQTHYDVYEAESGLVYTRMVERCIGGVQDKGACEAILQEWLKGNVTDKDNLVLRDHVCALITASAGGRRMLGVKLEMPALDAARYVDDHVWFSNPEKGLAAQMKASEVQLIRAGIWDPKTGFTTRIESKGYIMERPGDAFKIDASGGLSQAVIESEASLKALSQERWRQAMSSEVRWGLVASIFQSYNLSQLIRKYNAATGSPKAEAGLQLMMGCGGMACTVADLSGKILKNLPDRNLYMGNTLRTQSTKYMGEALGRWAARVSIGLAVVAAMPEVMKGMEEWDQGYRMRGRVTFVSALSGVGAVAFVTWECPIIAAICLAAFLGSNIYLSATKKAKIEEWLRRSSFGVGSTGNPPYTSMKQELDGLSFAFEMGL